MLENASYVWVEVDQHVVLLLDLVVPNLYLLLYPHTEGIPHDRVYAVGQVGTVQLSKVPFVRWEGLHHLRVPSGKAKEVSGGQSKVLRDLVHTHIFTLDDASFACGQVSHVVYAHGLVGAEVSSDLSSQKPVNLQ